MPIDLTGIANENQFFSDHYLAAVLEGDLRPFFEKWAEPADGTPKITPPWERLRSLAPSFRKMMRDQNDTDAILDRIDLQRELSARLLEALGYPCARSLRHLDSGFTIPVLAELVRPNGAPDLWVLEAVNPNVEPADPLSLTPILEQYPSGPEGHGLPDPPPSWEEIITADVFGAAEPPRWVLLLGPDQLLLLDRAKWSRKSLLRFDLTEILGRRETSTLRAMAALLHRDSVCPADRVSLLDALDENSHKHAFAVSEDLKYSAREAVELIGNEAVWYLREVLHEKVFGKNLEEQLTGECLRYLYRLLFLFYVEAREELGYAPMKSDEYRTGYSLESLRVVAEAPLVTEEARNGFFLHDSLQTLFRLVFDGFQHQVAHQGGYVRTFRMDPLSSDLFDPAVTPLLGRVRLRNATLQRVIELLSLSRPRRGARRGRISYAQLGINQLGSVYEGLLSYTGFFAEEDLYEVQRAGDIWDALAPAFFVRATALPEYREEEKCLDAEGRLRKHPKGSFIYRLSGRNREKSASFYTHESLTKCVVKYALKVLLEGKSADEILALTVCEPALGSGAFENEAVNQIAEAYLELKQRETGRTIRHEDLLREKQKVKAFLADNRVFGMDLNPVAIQLAEISLWLNTIYAGHTIPWFGGQLVAGNSLVGARRQAFTKEQLSGTDRAWLKAVPERVPLGTLRGADQVWHFLVPDGGMAHYTDGDVRALVPDDDKLIRAWKREFTKRFDATDVAALLRLSAAADRLWERHTNDLREVREKTAHIFPVFGQEENPAFKEYGERLTTAQRREIFERRILGVGAHGATPYKRLRLAMDYWCALWFWPIEEAKLLPTRDEWILELQAILEGTAQESGPSILGGEQVALFKGTEKGPRQEQLRLGAQLGEVDLEDLCARHPRLALVREIGTKHRFLHWELEYADIFRDRGGFDLTLGNPPWIKIEWNEGGVMGDVEPLYVIRRMSAPELARLREKTIENYPGLRATYLDEYVELTGLQNFLSAKQNFMLLESVQSNTYKSFLTRSWEGSSPMGVQGFLHPEGVYEDSNGGVLRREIYRRSRYHFQFQNVLKLFPEILHWIKYGVNVYGPRKPNSIDFVSISNLFHPSTIEACLAHDGDGECYGIKNNDNQWNLAGHADRIIRVNDEILCLFTQLYEEPGTQPGEARLPSLHAIGLVSVLRRFVEYPHRLASLDGQYDATEMWQETGAVQDGTIRRDTCFPNGLNGWILSGPHIGVANPFLKSPRTVCVQKDHFDLIDITQIPADYLPRTNYVPATDPATYRRRMSCVPWDTEKGFADCWRGLFRRRLSQTGERTLMGGLYPPGVGHVHPVLSLAMMSEEILSTFIGACASIPFDYYIKSTGKGDLYLSTLRNFPLLDHPKILSRSLYLNCLTCHYADLWRACYRPEFRDPPWAKTDPRLDPDRFSSLGPEWSWHTPLRTDFERRQALLEIDVLVAQALGLTLDELLTIYRIQFPVFRQYERNTFYDRNGRIVYLDGDSMYGFRTPEWKEIKDMKEGTVTRTIQDDTLPGGPREKVITYHAPFDCPNREADYAEAWAFFEKERG